MYQSNKTNGKLKLAARQTIAGRRGLLDGRLLFPGFADTNSMTRLGDFCKFLRTNCSQKIAQIFSNILGYCEKCHFLC